MIIDLLYHSAKPKKCEKAYLTQGRLEKNHKMIVNFYATLRHIVGGKSVEFSLPEGATVKILLDTMIDKYPDMHRELLNADHELYPHVHFFVNGRDAPYLENGLDTVLSPDDIVTVFPAVGGGVEACKQPNVRKKAHLVDQVHLSSQVEN